jgi:hypothetical protein
MNAITQPITRSSARTRQALLADQLHGADDERAARATCEAIDAVAKRKAGNMPGWEPCRYTRVGDIGDLLIHGCVPHTVTRGPRKGEKNFDGPLGQVVVTRAEWRRELSKRGITADAGVAAAILSRDPFLRRR